jgi:hypothetical protein
MSGKTMKLARKDARAVEKEIAKSTQVSYSDMVDSIRSYGLWDRFTISMSLLFNTESLALGQLWFWVFVLALIGLGSIFGWRYEMSIN